MVTFKKLVMIMSPIFVGYKLACRYLIHPDAKMLFMQRCKHYGFHVERHFVTTEDQYILQMFKINEKENDDLQKPSVVLQHGYDDSGY